MLSEEGLAKAKDVKDFCEHLVVTKGDHAGRPFKFLPWQWEDVVLPLFGTLKEDGTRQYRFCYCEIPKKSGKTPLAAVLGLYGLFGEDEAAPEVYIAAADRNQAGYCFDYAAQMVANEPTLLKYSKILSSQKKIINTVNNGFLLVLSAEAYTKHGINPSMLLIDELHAHPNDELFYTLTSGTHYARRQQIVFIMSTAGKWNKEHIWWRTREKARQIRDGLIKQDNFLPVLYIADPEKDRFDDENVWIKTNPSLGHLYTIEKMREEFQDAIRAKSAGDDVPLLDFMRYRLNIPQNNVSRFIPMDDWDKCGGELNPEKLAELSENGPYKLVCFGGLDVSWRFDLTALVFVFPPQHGIEKTCCFCKFYVPEDCILERSRTDNVHYDLWRDAGWITATPGDVVDTSYIYNDIVWADNHFNLKEVAFDRKQALELSTKVGDYVTMVELPQGYKLSEGAKALLGAIRQHEFNHGNNPVLRWNADNLVMTKGMNEDLRPDKSKVTDRIDGMVALIMAWSRLIVVEWGPSRYETEGVRVF